MRPAGHAKHPNPTPTKTEVPQCKKHRHAPGTSTQPWCAINGNERSVILRGAFSDEMAFCPSHTRTPSLPVSNTYLSVSRTVVATTGRIP